MKSKKPSPDTAPAAPAKDSPADAAESVTPEIVPADAAVSADELKQLKEQAAKAEENWNKFLRASADLDNYRKRVIREREGIVHAANERVVSALLPVLDNLERALQAVEQEQADKSAARVALLDGVRQIHAQFRRTLEELGLEEVEADAGHPFDPNLHEAVGQIEHTDHPEGAIAEQVQRGYRLASRLLRPAKVVVSKGAPNAE